MTTELEQTRDRLRRKLSFETRKRLNLYDSYYEGEQPLKFIAPALREEMGERLTELVINLCRYGVEAYDERLDVEGFRFPDDEAATTTSGRSGCTTTATSSRSRSTRTALALGRAYMLVSPGDDDEFPLITAESPFDAIHEDDPRTRDVAFGLKQYTDADGTQFATLYYPQGRTAWYREKRGGGWQLDAG
jgi:hypothetical protein